MIKKQEKWQDRFMTPEEIAQMEATFNEQFFDDLQKDENIFFEGHYEDGVCYLTLILKNEEETFYYPFETSISFKENPDLNDKEARVALLDFIGSYFDDYFSSQRETLVTIDWASYKLDDLNIYARGQVLNKKLESMADDILRSAGFDDLTDKKKKEEE
jgi:hypothetical protein